MINKYFYKYTWNLLDPNEMVLLYLNKEDDF